MTHAVVGEKKYQGIILFTFQRLNWWSIVATDDATAKKLRNSILNVVNTLESNQTDVICVCTDNSKANIAAFDDMYSHHEYSIIYPVNQPIQTNPVYDFSIGLLLIKHHAN